MHTPVLNHTKDKILANLRTTLSQEVDLICDALYSIQQAIVFAPRDCVLGTIRGR